MAKPWNEYKRSLNKGKNYSGDDAFSVGVNVEKLENLSEQLSKNADSLRDCYSNMFNTIDNLDNGVWNGQVYDAYKNYGKQYKESMMNYASNLSKYSSILKSAAEEGQILIDEVKKSVEVDL